MITARAENHIRGNPNLEDTIARLQAYERAGADVLYAPGLAGAEEIRTLCRATTKPLTWVAIAAMATAAEKMHREGDFSSLDVPAQVKRWLA